jgi:hypothetical protein
MTSKFRTVLTLFPVTVALLQGVALAIPSGGAAGWHAAAGVDGSSITNDGYSTYNVDSSASHNVTIDAGLESIGTSSLGFHIYGHNTGATLTCWTTATNVTTGATYTGSNSTTVNGYFNMSITVTIATGGTYSFGGFCTLPPWNTSSNYTRLYGILQAP